MIGSFGNGNIHAFPEGENWGIYEQNGTAVSVYAIHIRPGLIVPGPETMFVLLSKGSELLICPADAFLNWDAKRSYGDLNRAPLKGMPVVIHPEHLFVPGERLGFASLNDQGNAYLLFLRCGAAPKAIQQLTQPILLH